MNKLKKVLGKALVVTLVSGLLLTGCGNKVSDQSEKSITKSTAQTTSVPETQKLEPVELTWYYPGPYPLKDQDAVFTEASNLIKEKINATVNFKATNWGEYEDKMKVIMAAGDPWDLCFTSNWMNNYQMAVSKGAYLALDELLTKYAPKLYASIPADFWNAPKINGKIYGLINYQIVARVPAAGFIKEFVDLTGFDINSVKKIEDLEPFFKSMKEKKPDVVPGKIEWEGINDYYAFDTLSGLITPGVISMKDSSLKVFNQFESQEFKDYINLKKAWEAKGYLHAQELISMKDYAPLSKQKKLAMGVGGTYKPGMDAEANAALGFENVSIPMGTPYVTTGGVIATMHAVNRNSANPERAMMLMELINSDVPLYNLIAMGREGKDYNKLADGTVEVQKDAGYNPGTLWLHASTFNAYILKGQPLDVWEQTKKLNSSAKASPAIGFTFNPEPVKNEVAQTTSVVTEYIKGFNFGIMDIDKDYPVFIDKLDKAGAKTIIAEMQKQIDAWKTTK